MTDSAVPETTSDERLMGALAHLVGLFLALLIWATQKDRSRFVRFQALQASVFDGISMVGFLGIAAALLAAGLTVPFGLALGLQQVQPGSIQEWPLMLMGLTPFVMVLAMLGIFAGWLAIRVWAAISVFGGKNFHYPIIGQMVQRTLEK